MTVAYQEENDQREALATVLQSLFGEQARASARETGFVQRQSPIDGAAFVRALVFGFVENPDASYTDLQQMLACQKVVVSPQALEQRMTEKATRFLHRMLEAVLTVILVGEQCDIGVLEGFNGVYLQDGTSISLPDELKSVWRGKGGRTGTGGEAGVSVQVRLELQHGQLEGPWLQDGRANER